MILVYPVGIPLLFFALLYPNRQHIANLLMAARDHDLEESRVSSLGSLKRNSKRRPANFQILDQLECLQKLFRNYHARSWWSGIFMLVTRLCQTR